MNRTFFPLVVVVSLLVCSIAFGQNPGSAGRPAPGRADWRKVPGMPPLATAATPHRPALRLRGRVVAAHNGAPLRRAQVTASVVQDQIRRTTTTDADGRYEFLDLPAGRFSVSVTKTGYVTLQYGQRRTFEAGTPITLTMASGSSASTSVCRAERSSRCASPMTSAIRSRARSCKCNATSTELTVSDD